MSKDMEMDEDGYPTDDTLETIKTWPIESLANCESLLDEIRTLWRYPNYFTRSNRTYRDHPGGPRKRKYRVSTGGWSGHESIIGALQENYLFWGFTWVSSRRGGHYEFEV